MTTQDKSMRFLFGFILFAVGIAASQDMTGREYFNELKTSNAFNHFSDEYVCFHDDNGLCNDGKGSRHGC